MNIFHGFMGYGMHGIKLHLYAVHAIHEMHQVVRIQCVKKDQLHSLVLSQQDQTREARHCHNTTSLFYNPVSPLTADGHQTINFFFRKDTKELITCSVQLSSLYFQQIIACPATWVLAFIDVVLARLCFLVAFVLLRVQGYIIQEHGYQNE